MFEVNHFKLHRIMKFLLKFLKRIFKLLAVVLFVIILMGLTFRFFGHTPQAPEGKLIDVGGFKLHINSSGKKNDKPTLIIEGGAGVASEYYHWLSLGLQDSIRVVRYDRAGLGYSDESNTPRDPETVAHELHLLLKNAGESPPYIMAGHSIGGAFIRVFTKLYPNEVAGLIFLDSSHPEQVERINLTKKASTKYKLVLAVLNIQAVLGDLGILTMYESFTGPLLAAEGLPEKVNNRTRDFFTDGKYVRAYRNEIKYFHSTLKRAGKANDFGSLPIRVFTAKEFSSKEWIKMQKEIANLSTNGKQISLNGNHATIFTKKENADIICNEVFSLLKTLTY